MDKKRCIDLYEQTVLKYFEQIQTTELVNREKNENIIYIGLNTLIHIFRISLYKHKNLDIAYYYCKQSYFYYLEYIDQIANTDALQHLNYNNAVLFVYTKALCDNAENEQLLQDAQELQMDGFAELLNQLSNITNILLLWNIEKLDITTRIQMVRTFLSKYIHIFSSNEAYIYTLRVIYDFLCDHTVDINTFHHLFQSFYKQMKKKKRTKSEHEIYNDILLWKTKCLDEDTLENTQNSLEREKSCNKIIAVYYSHVFG